MACCRTGPCTCCASTRLTSSQIGCEARIVHMIGISRSIDRRIRNSIGAGPAPTGKSHTEGRRKCAQLRNAPIIIRDLDCWFVDWRLRISWKGWQQARLCRHRRRSHSRARSLRPESLPHPSFASLIFGLRKLTTHKASTRIMHGREVLVLPEHRNMSAAMVARAGPGRR